MPIPLVHVEMKLVTLVLHQRYKNRLLITIFSDPRSVHPYATFIKPIGQLQLRKSGQKLSKVAHHIIKAKSQRNKKRNQRPCFTKLISDNVSLTQANMD